MRPQSCGVLRSHTNTAYKNTKPIQTLASTYGEQLVLKRIGSLKLMFKYGELNICPSIQCRSISSEIALRQSFLIRVTFLIWLTCSCIDALSYCKISWPTKMVSLGLLKGTKQTWTKQQRLISTPKTVPPNTKLQVIPTMTLRSLVFMPW